MKVALLSPRSPLALMSFACTLMCALAASLAAQQDEDPNAPRLTVMTFRSQEQELGAKVADMLRQQLANDVPSKEATIIPTDLVDTNLAQSGYTPQDALASSDEQALAKLLRSDFYVTGTIDHSNKRYRMDARVMLPHDILFTQPLPPVTGKDLDDLVQSVAQSVRQALKQYPGYHKCIAELNADHPKYDVALAAARGAVRVYPRATWAMTCIMGVYYRELGNRAKTHADSLAYADSTLTWSLALLQQDSLNVTALRFNADLFKFRGDTAREQETLLSLAAADPSAANDVITTLGREGRAAAALPLVKRQLEKTPEDVPLLRNAFLVYLNASDWANAVQIGQTLVRLDTTAADTLYFLRVAHAYHELKQPQQVLDILAQGTAKYPNNLTLLKVTGTMLRDAGQTQQALDALRHILILSSNDIPTMIQIATLYDQQNLPDSVVVIVGRAASLSAASPTDKQILAQLALKEGTAAFKTATASKSRDDYQKAIQYLQQSNALAPSVDAQFLIGASSFNIMQSAATAAKEKKDCALAQLAQRSLVDAQKNLPAGAQDPKYQGAAQSMLQYLPQFVSPIQSEIKQFCH